MINIKWLEDEHDCDTCGFSYSQGAIVTGDVEIEHIPVAHCFNSKHWDREEIYLEIINKLGYKICESY